MLIITFLFLFTISYCLGSGNDKPTKQCSSVFLCEDCGTSKVCWPDSTGLLSTHYTFHCPSERPFCNAATGSCSATPDLNCGKKDNKFYCSGDDIFPDGNDCKKYHDCKNFEQRMYTCKKGNYNINKGTCSTDSDCVKADCDGKTGYKVKLGTTDFYSYCSEGKSLLVAKCPPNYMLNEETQQCEALQCEHPGVIPNIYNCSQYYACLKDPVYPNKYTRVMRTCPANEAYDIKTFDCVPKAQIGCKQ